MQPWSHFLACVLLAAILTAALPSPPARATGEPGFGVGRARAAREVVDRIRGKVVLLKTVRAGRRGSACGFLAAAMLVMTAAHTVEGTGTITAWLNGVPYRAELLARHEAADAALLRLNGPALHLKPAELAPDLNAVERGEPLVILAGAGRNENTRGEPEERVPIEATLAARRPVWLPNGGTASMLEMRGSVARGDSGSPVLRLRDGKVVGVLSSRTIADEEGVSGTAYAVPSDVLAAWLDKIRDRLHPREEFYLLRR